MTSPGRCSIALFPFWCLDAKGGEVVLFRFSEGFAEGRAQVHLLLSFIC